MVRGTDDSLGGAKAVHYKNLELKNELKVLWECNENGETVYDLTKERAILDN